MKLELGTLDTRSRELVMALVDANGERSQLDLVKAAVGGILSQPTMSRVLARLIADGWVLKVGSTRGAGFLSAPDARRAVLRYRREHAGDKPAKPVVRRKPSTRRQFDLPKWAELWGNHVKWPYLEQAGDWFTPEQMQRMRPKPRLFGYTYGAVAEDRLLTDFCWATCELSGDKIGLHEVEGIIHDHHPTLTDWDHRLWIVRNTRDVLVGLRRYRNTWINPDLEMAKDIHAKLMAGLTGGRGGDLLIGQGPRLRALTDLCRTIANPLERSLRFLIGYSYILPFAKGNDHLARVLCNVPLIQTGLPGMSFVGFSEDGFDELMEAFARDGDFRPMAEAYATQYSNWSERYLVDPILIPDPFETIDFDETQFRPG